MAVQKTKRSPKGTTRRRTKSAPKGSALSRLWRWILRWVFRVGGVVIGVFLLSVLLLTQVNPPTTHTIWSEGQRLGSVDRVWRDADEIAPVMFRAAVAAEDANFCTHWGFDMGAIRAAIEAGGARGGSTISQQVVKNVWLWQGRSYTRKALEALMTPVVEAIWSKRRLLEVYLNIAEFGEGVFGVEAAARASFGVGAGDLSARQAALLAAVLPAPKSRNPARPTTFLDKRARSIMSGAATIDADGRAACFQD